MSGPRLDYTIVLAQLFALRLPFGLLVGALLLGGAVSLPACGGKASGGSPASTQPRACTYAGQSHANGDSFPSTNGCNTCACDDGEVTCTLKGCDPDPSPEPPISCEQVDVFYQQLLAESKVCDPHDPDPCSYRVKSGLGCGCDTFVNPERWDAAQASAFATHYRSFDCGSGVACGECAPSPLRGRCTLQHGCEDTTEPKPGPGCKVNGVVYPDGAAGIPDPISCNACSCNAGQLSCTEENCPRPCPTGTVLSTSCAQCGPTDACEVVEHACFPSCTATCAEGVCFHGACLTGMCG